MQRAALGLSLHLKVLGSMVIVRRWAWIFLGTTILLGITNRFVMGAVYRQTADFKTLTRLGESAVLALAATVSTAFSAAIVLFVLFALANFP